MKVQAKTYYHLIRKGSLKLGSKNRIILPNRKSNCSCIFEYKKIILLIIANPSGIDPDNTRENSSVGFSKQEFSMPKENICDNLGFRFYY